MSRELTAESLAELTSELAQARSKIEELESDNYGYRSKLRDMNEKLAAALATVPPEGALVLLDADVETWNALSAMGTPDDLTAKLAMLEELKANVATLARTEELRTVADAAHYDFDVLSALASNLEFEVKEVEGEEGKAVRVKTGDGSLLSLDDYASQNWSKFLPSLVQNHEGPQGNSSKRMPPQYRSRTPAGKGAGNDVLSSFLDQRNSRKKANPLIPRQKESHNDDS